MAANYDTEKQPHLFQRRVHWQFGTIESDSSGCWNVCCYNVRVLEKAGVRGYCCIHSQGARPPSLEPALIARQIAHNNMPCTIGLSYLINHAIVEP
jgi:hypothetical protein